MRKLPAVRIPLNYFWKSRCLGSVETLLPKARSLRMVCALKARIFSTNPRRPPILFSPAMKKRHDEPEERRRKQESRYIGMVRAVFKVCKRQCIPLYSSKYSGRRRLRRSAGGDPSSGKKQESDGHHKVP